MIGDSEGINVVLKKAGKVDASVRAVDWLQNHYHAANLPVIRDLVTCYADN